MEELKNICSIVHLSSHFSLPRDQTKEYKKQEINSSRDILNLEINKIFNLTLERLRNVPTFILARRSSSRRKVRGMNQKRLTIPSINHQQVRLNTRRSEQRKFLIVERSPRKVQIEIHLDSLSLVTQRPYTFSRRRYTYVQNEFPSRLLTKVAAKVKDNRG